MDDSAGVARDLLANDIHIQATHRLTEALYASEKRMRRRIERLSEVIYETDGEGRLTYLNRAWTAILGFDVDGSLGQRLASFVAEADREFLAGDRAQVRFLHATGAVVWMDLTATALEEGGHVGALRDVTEYRIAQAEVTKLSMVASNTDNLVLITDAEGRVEWVNLAFSRKTGYNLSEIVGRKPGELLQGPGTDPSTRTMLGEGLREGRSLQCEILNYTKWGQAYWVEMHISPIRDGKGRVERFVAIQTDITALRRAQEELKAAKEAAESASDAKTQFLATISHEMRTPLNVILGTTELALECEREHGVPPVLTKIHENAETLLGLISDLLDVSKVEAGQIEWERVRFPLRTRLRQALSPVAERAIRKGLDFQVRIDERLPEMVMGDPARLRQIVANLGENAVKFTDRGFVRMEAAEENGRLRIRVADSGAGIPAAAIPHIFDRFFQGDGSTTRRKGGAGLGLSIVKSLVDAMGGTVTVQSEVGEGAEFVLLLPLEAVVEEGAAAAGAPIEPVAPGRLILVAEDNDDNYLIVARHLTNSGYRVERAVNGVEAVAAAGRSRYDLILMDIEMPEMDGLEATRQIRRMEAQAGRGGVPILALTAHAVMGYRERCLQVGCTGYLSKPVRKQGLLEGVAAAMAGGQTILSHFSPGAR